MAEIKIEKKAPIWPWVIAGVILVAALAYFLFVRNGTDNKVMMDRDSTGTEMVDGNSNSVVTAFTSFVDRDTASMDLDHEYTHDAIVKLVDATQAMTDKTGYDAKVDIDAARNYADKITVDPSVTTHADNIKRATELLSTALKNIQVAHFPQLSAESDNVTSASQAIGTDELTLDQKSAIKSYFNNASTLLKKMN